MGARAERKTRSYMAAGDRRLHLLEAGGRLVAESGWEGLTMQRLAEAAGVSRQLVYEHFETLDEFRQTLLVHLFEPSFEATRAIARSDGGAHERIRRAYELMLDMPPQQRMLLRSLVNAEPSDASELGRVRQTLRRRVATLWAPVVTSETGLRGADARSLAWAVLVAGFAFADLVQTRELGRKAAIDLFVRVAEGALAGTRVRPR